MKIQVYSQDRNLFNLINPLRSVGCSVAPYDSSSNNSPDVIIFESEMADTIKYNNCLKIEYVNTNDKKTDNFSLSMIPGSVNVDYQLPALCSLMPKGVVRDGFVCDLSSNNQPPESISLFPHLLNLDHKVRIFSAIPLNIYCYCGVITPTEFNDLYVSSKLNLCTTEYSVVNVIQAGGVPFSNVTSFDIPEELKFTEGNCEERLKELLPIAKFTESLSKLREEIVNSRNVYRQWSNIFNKVGLKKLSERCLSHGNRRAKDLLSQ